MSGMGNRNRCWRISCASLLTVGLFLLLNVRHSQQESGNQSGLRNCPCEDAHLCEPIPASQFPRKEVYGFAINTSKEVYMKYDWSKLTTLAMWEFTDDLMCFAHSKGVRLDLVVSQLPKENITDAAWRKKFIQEKINIIQHGFLDGLNYDPEYGVDLGSPERKALVDLVNETKIALRKVLPDSKVSFDVAWASFCVDERCYDYKGLADAADWLFVMSYDIQGQIWGPHCIAMSNTPYGKMVDGIFGYLALGIPPSKLVLGLPWYGYDYPCESLSSNDICDIPQATFHGAPCSDLVGNQRNIDEMLVLLQNSTTGRKWNLDGEAPQFTYTNASGHLRQVHYDDPESLVLRYLFAVDQDLRGVGFWHVGCMTDMELSGNAPMRKEMWDLVPNAASWKSYIIDHKKNASVKISTR